MKPAFFLRESLRLLNSFRVLLCTLVLFAIIMSISGCSYYKVKKDNLPSPPTNQEIQSLSPEERYVIIHSGRQMMHLNRVTLNEDKKELSGVLTTLNEEHRYIRPEHNKTYRYRKSKHDPLNEVHFYTSENLNLNVGDEVVIPFSILDSVSVNKFNTGRTVLNIAASSVGLFVVGVAVILATKSSCPFIYIKDGEHFVFTGELYPGAITPNIQRDDYIPLPGFKPEGKDYIIKITNELHEVQHTDLAQLIVVKHPREVKVLVDSEGGIQSFSDIQAPKKAFSDDLSGTLENVLRQDNRSYMFDSDSKTADGSRSMILEFSRPAGAKQAKLFLTTKNSFWLDYTFGKFNEQFGSYYSNFQKQQLKTPGEESIQWAIDQKIPLSIYLKTKKGWELVERLNSVGPLAYRDIVVPIDLRQLEHENVELKLETGFMFWEIDRAGMDFSENADLEKIVLEPSFAVDEKGHNVTDLLKRSDGKYLTQPEIGNEAVVSFRYEAEDQNLQTSLFLKNRGYYTYIRNYKGIPDFAELRSFKNKGRFTRFSEEQYEKFVREEILDFALTYGN